MKQKKNPHDEPKLYWFDNFLKMGELPVFRELKLLMSLIFIRVAPEIPVSLRKSYSGPDGLRAGIIGFVTTFFFTFIVTAFGSKINHTLYNQTLFAGKTLINAETTNVIYFLDDWWNVLLYTLVCPMYVGLTCWLVVVVVKGYGEIKEFKRKEISVENKPARFSLIKSLALGILILSVAFLLTANYINDIMTLTERGKYYWFLSEVNGKYQIGALGVYYFLLNYSLLIVTLIALTFFMSIYGLIMKVGQALESKEEIGALEFKTLQEKLYMFTEAYIISKGIVACYVVNIWVWADSPLGKGITDNFAFAVVLLALIGVFLVSFPRYFVELQWYKLKLRSSSKIEIDTSYEDLRTFRVKNIAHLLDYLFIGGFVIYAIRYVIGL